MFICDIDENVLQIILYTNKICDDEYVAKAMFKRFL